MTDLTGYFYIDGIDLWSTFSMFISKGSSDLLRYPPKKPSIEHDWPDQNGVDVDLSRFFFQKRTINLKCGIVVGSESIYWARKNAFIALMTKPGKRRLSITSHGARSYFIYYQDCTTMEKYRGLTGEDAHLVAYLFTLVVVEPEPMLEPSANIPLVDDNRQPILI